MPLETILKYPSAFFAAFLVALVFTPVMRALCRKFNLLDKPDARRIHAAPTPRCGGPAVFLGFHAACAVMFLVPWLPFMGIVTRQWWLKHMLLSGFVLAVGIIDDIRGLRAWVKLGSQMLAAAAAYAFGMRFGGAFLLQMPPLVDFCLTLLWILAITNAFNLIDGLDGLAAGLAVIASLGMAGGLLFRHLPGDALLLLGLAGACSAFLLFNFHPASIFLGDSGSMFIGFSLAVIALSTSSKGAAIASIAVPLLAVGVPIFDTLLAVWRRVVRRLFPSGTGHGMVMQPDTDHIHHRLLRTGLSQRHAAGILYGISSVLTAAALLAMVYKTRATGVFLIAFVAAVYIIVKHLARIELWDSASALLTGLSRPPRRAIPVLLYIVWDLFVMAAASAFVLWLILPKTPFENFRLVWFDNLPVWLGIPFLAIFFSKAYSRVWARARILDYFELGSAVAAGVVLAAGTAILSGEPATRGLLLQTLLYAGIAAPLISGGRAIYRILEDAVMLAGRHPTVLGARPPANTCLVYGAGARGVLFLRWRAHSTTAAKQRPGRYVLGFIDDDPIARGRYVYGYPVLGGIEDLERILDKKKPTEIIVTCSLPPERAARLLKAAAERNIPVSEWEILETAFSAPQP